MIEMPNELISARWKSSFWSTLLKLSQVHSFGRNWGLPAAVSACGLNDSMIIHTTGSRHHTRIRMPPMMMPGLSLWPHQASLLAAARSTRKSFTRMKAMIRTDRKSSTDSADPRPSSNCSMTWR